MKKLINKISNVYSSIKELYTMSRELREQIKWFNSLSTEEKTKLKEAFKILNRYEN